MAPYLAGAGCGVVALPLAAPLLLETLCVLQLQPGFTDTAGVTRVQQPRMGKQMISPCLANLPAAVVRCLSRLIPPPLPMLSPSTSPPLHCLSGSSRSLAWLAQGLCNIQGLMKVGALTFTLMETEAMQDWGGKENVEHGSGRKKCQIAGRRTAFIRLQSHFKTSTRWPKMGRFQPDRQIFGKSI